MKPHVLCSIKRCTSYGGPRAGGIVQSEIGNESLAALFRGNTVFEVWLYGLEGMMAWMANIPSDIEIAQSAQLRDIETIGASLGLTREHLIPYGRTKAKIDPSVSGTLAKRDAARMILVTALTATRSGDGKTVTSIGLAQAMGQLGVSHCLCLREPSLGPTFGIKGGAAGGGYAQLLPMEDINMHFTGDMHAITSANNLLSAVIDNSIHFDNPMDIEPEGILWRRVIDLCDRQLRNIQLGLGGPANGFPHPGGFDITAASEVMAVMALSKDREDLRERLGCIVVAYDRKGQPRYAREFGCIGALEVLLKDALMPNLVQTIEHTPAMVHCGPFANIAHGCNSVNPRPSSAVSLRTMW